MLKPIQLPATTAQFIRGASEQTESEALANMTFRILHGFYGTLFSAKFSTGKINSEGKDEGVISARKVWAYELKKFDRQSVSGAIDDCKKAHPDFPPSLPQFIALCAANVIRETYKSDVLTIGMGQEIRSQYARQARAIITKHTETTVAKRVGFIQIEASLSGLKTAIANAVACAGGDEVKELLRLDRLFAKAPSHA